MCQAIQWLQLEILFLFCGQYVADVKMVQKLLQEAEQAISIINKEEDFYKLDQTCYPEVELIRDCVELYQKLFGLVLNWQRTESRSDFSLMHAMLKWTQLL